MSQILVDVAQRIEKEIGRSRELEGITAAWKDVTATNMPMVHKASSFTEFQELPRVQGRLNEEINGSLM